MRKYPCYDTEMVHPRQQRNEVRKKEKKDAAIRCTVISRDADAVGFSIVSASDSSNYNRICVRLTLQVKKA